MAHGQEKAAFLRSMGVESVIDAAALKQPLSKAVKAAAPKGRWRCKQWGKGTGQQTWELARERGGLLRKHLCCLPCCVDTP